MIRSVPSSDTTARCRLSGEKEKPLILEFDILQAATGLVFWFLEYTDLLICNGLYSFSVPLVSGM